jgi:hypothetical protein
VLREATSPPLPASPISGSTPLGAIRTRIDPEGYSPPCCPTCSTAQSPNWLDWQASLICFTRGPICAASSWISTSCS